MSKSKFLTPYEGWALSVRNAVASGQPPSLPPNSPEMSHEQFREWRDCIVKLIAVGEQPITPEQWLRSQQNPDETAHQRSRRLQDAVNEHRQQQADRRRQQTQEQMEGELDGGR